MNIAAHLPEMAARQPDALAVAVQGRRGADGRHAYRQLTAKELEEESNRLARGLEGIGVGRGIRTVLMVRPSLEFFALTFALFKVGAIPVMVDPGLGIKNLKQCLEEAEPEAFIGIPKAHAARVLLGWGRKTIRTCVTAGPRLFWGGHTLKGIRDSNPDFEPAAVEADEMAAILYTSGSTGPPKGAVYTHGVFQAQVDLLRDEYEIQPGERDLATFPLFALFGPALGMAAVVPNIDASRPITANPRNLAAAMEDFQTTNLFASPALIDVIGRYCESEGVKLPMLKRVISAGAPANYQAIERLRTALSPGVQIHPSYGATEALPVASIGSDELLGDTLEATQEGAGICVGRPCEGIGLRIIKITDDAIPTWREDLECSPGETGEICVQGPIVTRAYYNRPEATALAKIEDPQTGAILHRMGDLGYVDDSGRLWFCGRKSHRVVTPGETLFTIPCERVFDTHPHVKRTALVGVSKEGKTIPVLCVELSLDAPESCKGRLKHEVLEIGQRHGHTRPIHKVLLHPGFPVDVRHNAKIFREKLAIWAQGQLP